MTESVKKYYSKVLLFGEFTVTMGYGGLAIPYCRYSGFWEYNQNKAIYQNGLEKLYSFLKNNIYLVNLYNLAGFKSDIDTGLVFSSDIPQGYGMGSSGALVAAFYDKYAFNKIQEVSELRDILAKTESAFHGLSSGIDPLVSYLNLPIEILGTESRIITDFKIKTNGIYLIDTKIPRTTQTLITIFNKKVKSDKRFKEKIRQLGIYNQNAIEALKRGHYSDLFSWFRQISLIQYEYFSEMIPDMISKFWMDGLKSEDYYVKLCGAGGGGMMLCMPKPNMKLPDSLDGFTILAM